MNSYRPYCLILAFSLVATFSSLARAAVQRAAILDCDLPGHSPELLDALTAQLEPEYQVGRIGLETLFEPDGLQDNPPDLLVLPNSAVIPAHAAPAIHAYLKTGRNLIALRTPLSLKPPVLIDGQWLDKQEYLSAQAGKMPPHVLFDFAEGFAGWDRVTNNPQWTTAATLVPDAIAPGHNAVHVRIADLEGWDTYQAPARQPYFAPGHTLTVLTAKGTGHTSELSIEWEERDGSRWIAVVPLAQHFKRIIVAPEEFRYWASNPKRGGANDRFNPANAVVLKIGLAFSHTGPVRGPHEYWLGPIGTAARTPEIDQFIGDFSLPALDTICPSYKLFDCSDVASLTVRKDQAIIAPAKLPNSAAVRSPHPRPGGGGFDKGRTWRWIPLIEARTAAGQWRGTPATLTLHSDGPFKGGAWASFGIDDDQWYKAPESLAVIGQVAKRMALKAYLVDAGAEFFTAFDDQSVRIGARVFQKDETGGGPLTARVSITDFETGKEVRKYEWPVDARAGNLTSVADAFTPEQRAGRNTLHSSHRKEAYICTAQLLHGSQVIDTVAHELHFWHPKPLAERTYMTVADGNFMHAGKRWRAHGINYMPSSGIGTEDQHYFEDWTGARSYDPEIIQRDLENVKRIGYNSVSVFTDYRLIKWQNTVDLIRRCDELGLMVNLSIRPGTPMDFQWAKIRETIEALRLAEHDNLFAYDLAWEPHFGRQPDRVRWDRHWEAWINERYGSVEKAEKDWEFAVPRTAEGKITNPSGEQLLADGPWRRMVAAYRRFLDTLLYKKYEAARRLVRGIDPHHLVSFRMTEAGNPTCRWEGMLPYDFPYLVNAVDFLAPEAYGRIGDWEQVKPGWFELEYGRWAEPDKPFIWAEQGMHTWSPSTGGNSPYLLARQADFYREFYRMMIASGADGIFSWWYPGGFRYNENSDYGIINPDGSDRPVTKVIRQMAEPFLEGADPKPIDAWLEFDRDAHPDGIAGAYDAVKDQFWKAIGDGKTPGLRTAATGTNSRNCPALAVGNTPANGSNPPKYLDAAFDVVEFQTSDGQWLRVEAGATLRVPAGAAASQIRLRVTVINLGEAAWIAESGNPAAPESLGAVFFHVMAGNTPARQPIPADLPTRRSFEAVPLVLDVGPFGGSVEIALTMDSPGRGQFGERFRFTLATEQ